VTSGSTTSYVFGWPIWVSIAVHGAALATASTVIALTPHAPPPEPAPVEVVRIESPPPPPPPPPERPKPPPRERVVRPQIVEQPAPPVEPIEQPQTAAPTLLTDAPRREIAPSTGAPTDPGQRFLSGGPNSSWALSGGPGVGTSGSSSNLFSTGDIPLPPAGGGNKQTASTGSNPEGLTAFARPLGGYQTRPRYPDSARRQGIEGEALLRFHVMTDGHVESVTVSRSAGHPELDRAAVDAVKTWRFEPARRGEEKVAVWVTLPVRFSLQSGTLE
jgi:protein TonB